jgi:superfamily I DNA/RNA helicase
VAAAVEVGCDPGRILVITFTNRAADEARERLVRALGPGSALPVVSTFHAFALSELCRLARERGEPVPRVREGPEDPDGLALDELVPALAGRLEADAAYREDLAGRFEHVLVDEFQDIGRDQYTLVSLLRPRSLFAVGDPDQSIYGFRGADPAAFDRFRADRPGTIVHALTVSHRGTPEVLGLAARVVRRSGDVSGSAGSLRSARASGPAIRLYRARSPADEADWIRREIAGLVGGLDMLDARAEAGRTGLADVAVLGRTHAVLDPVARALSEAGIPTERASDRPLWNLAWVGAAMKALAAADPGTGGRDVAKGALGPLDVPVRDAAVLVSLIGDLPAGEALRKLQTLAEIDAIGLAPERVRLLTIHAAKGLEFDAVFVAGCEEGVFPPFGAGTARVDLDEESRLLYVAATRSRGVLALSWAANGGRGTGALSRFLDRLPAGVLEFVDGTEGRKPRKAVQQELF